MKCSLCYTGKTMSRNSEQSVYVTEHCLLETESEVQHREPECAKDDRQEEGFAWNKNALYCVL